MSQAVLDLIRTDITALTAHDDRRVGSRGADVYGRYIEQHPELGRVVAVAEGHVWTGGENGDWHLRTLALALELVG